MNRSRGVHGKFKKQAASKRCLVILVSGRIKKTASLRGVHPTTLTPALTLMIRSVVPACPRREVESPPRCHVVVTFSAWI